MTAPTPKISGPYRLGVAVLLLAAFFNHLRLLDIPPGPRFDELQDMLLVRQVLAGRRPLYFSGNYGEEPITIYLEAASVSLLGWNDLAMRLPATYLGLITVALIYALGRGLFSPLAGLVGSALAAVNLWLVLFSRLGLNPAALPPCVALALYGFWRGLHPRGSASATWQSPGWLSLGGLALGGSVYAYTAGRTFPVYIVLLAAYLLAFHTDQVRARWPGLVAYAATASASGWRLLVYLRANPGAETRLDALQGAIGSARQGDPGQLLNLIWRALAMFGIRGGDEWLYNVAGRPIFDPLTALVLAVGLAVALSQLRRLASALVLSAFAAGLVPAMLAGPPGSPNHALFALPSTFLLAGLGASTLGSGLRRMRREGWAVPVLGGLIALNAGLNFQAYFKTWAESPEVRWEHQAGATEVGRYLDAHPPPGSVVIAADNAGYYNPAMRLGYEISTHRARPVRWFQPTGAFIWPSGPGPATYFFPQHTPPGITLAEPLARRFFSGAQLFLDQHFSDGEPAFTAYRLLNAAPPETSAPGLAVRWPSDLSLSGRPELPISFEGELELTDFEIDPADAKPGGEVWLLTYWRVREPTERPAIQFVHVLDGEGRLHTQSDRLDVWLPSLQPGDAYVQLHHLTLPADAPAGDYWFQVGLYAPDDMTRLHITFGGQPVADRVWLGPLVVQPG